MFSTMLINVFRNKSHSIGHGHISMVRVSSLRYRSLYLFYPFLKSNEKSSLHFSAGLFSLVLRSFSTDSTTASSSSSTPSEPPPLSLFGNREPNLGYIHQYIKDYCYKRAKDAFDWMKFHSYPMDHEFFNSIIQRLSKQDMFMQNINSMIEYYEEMKKMKIQPTVETFNYLIDGFAKKADAVYAMKYFEEMKSLGIKPNLQTFNALINAFGKHGDTDTMLIFFDDLKRHGFKPSGKTYNIIMSAFGKKHDPEKMIFYFEEMKKQNLKPTVETAFTVIKAFAEKLDIDSMCRYFEEFVRTFHIRPNASTFYNIVKAFGKKKDKDSMIKYIGEARALKVELSNSLWALLDPHFPAIPGTQGMDLETRLKIQEEYEAKMKNQQELTIEPLISSSFELNSTGKLGNSEEASRKEIDIPNSKKRLRRKTLEISSASPSETKQV